MSVNRSFENKLTHAFLSFLFFSHRLIQIDFGLFDYFFFVLSNKYYLSKLMLLDFRCQKISFLRKHNFCIDEKHTQWHWDKSISWKHFMVHECPWNCISRNALKEIFHSVSFRLEDVFWRQRWKTSLRCLQHVLIKTNVCWAYSFFKDLTRISNLYDRRSYDFRGSCE